MVEQGRRRQAGIKGGRTIRHRVQVTQEQEDALTERADARGVTISKLLVDSALDTPISTDRVLIQELTGVRRRLDEVQTCIAKEAANIEIASRNTNAGRWDEQEWVDLRTGILGRNEKLSELFGKWDV